MSKKFRSKMRPRKPVVLNEVSKVSESGEGKNIVRKSLEQMKHEAVYNAKIRNAARGRK